LSSYLAGKRYFTQLSNRGVEVATQILEDYEYIKLHYNEFTAARYLSLVYKEM